MKINSITITGMHKVATKKYDINSDITYFVGKNGAGKSTVLEAIQLALLGYIPGYDKKNESIMKHAPGPVMAVEAEFDDGTHVTRTWTKSGASYQCKSDIQGNEEAIADLTSEVNLPIVDFNKFKSLTANKLKEWFIKFLPTSDEDIDILAELKNVADTRVLDATELLKSVAESISISGLSGLDLVASLNAEFKEDVSYTKGQIAKLESTIQSLIKYDDAEDLDTFEINSEINELNLLKNRLIEHTANLRVRENAINSLEEVKKALKADSFENDPDALNLKDQISYLQKQGDVLKKDYADIKAQLDELNREKASLPLTASICPYTQEHCESAAKLSGEIASKRATLVDQIKFKEEELKDCSPKAISENDRHIMQLQAQLGALQSKYDRYTMLKAQVSKLEETEAPTAMTLPEIDEKLRQLNELLAHAIANEKYFQLSEKITADKFKLANDLELYKLWEKKTSANDLQTTLMNKPFESLSDDMSDYLTQMFNTPVRAKFNLTTKANSFGFGLERDGGYIEFDYLSSGERCLFTLALMMCILDKSNSTCRILLIDDILDHLDTDNASYLFESLKNVSNIQFILAGVQPCGDSTFCVEIQ